METFDVSLLRRSIGQKRTHQSIKPLYSHKTWATDLDIVNELGGHTGCVNALNWSKGGRLLASGSDDTYLNIWEYNPASTARPFTLNTSVATGHHANIFSVKFMPHSSDRTVVTCAGDSEVRVFDLEYGGAGRSDADNIASTRSRRFNEFFHHARWLSEANTNARVYRSHSDRAKRVVTESSPHLFLTCSEDGEVRQWDLRQPSSAYPSPRGARRLGRFRNNTSLTDDNPGDVPPPLISYRKYDIDLNSISCSASQPHYIALGGKHLHCFLHDRRMLGRDIAAESGQPGVRSPAPDTQADEAMFEATRCVRRFAPNNKRSMRPHSSGHITACKISDARPNELISSWSGDHIYSFDIVKSPDARDTEVRREQAHQESRLRNQAERKRKRAAKAEASVNSLGKRNACKHHLGRMANQMQAEGRTAVRVKHSNGETGEASTGTRPETIPLPLDDALLTEAQQQAQRVARSLVRLRKTIFDFSATMHEGDPTTMENSPELTPFTSNLSNALGEACVLLPEIEDIMRDWSYPVNPSPDEVELQNRLRKNRQAVWRFVQATGVISKVLGGRLMTMSGAADPRLEKFDTVKPAPREKLDDDSRFYYDFIKAIFLWLHGGAPAVLEGFRKPADRPELSAARFPFTNEDSLETMPEKLRVTLHSLANEDKPILDLDENRFIIDEQRSVFQTQQQGVNAFVRALANIELKMHQGLSEPGIYSSGPAKRVMDKGAAARFWGIKVGRSLLMDASKGIDFDFVQQAFGGSRLRVVPDPESPLEAEDLVSAALELLVGSAAAGDSHVDGGADLEMAEAFATPTGIEDQSEEREQSIIFEEDDDDDDGDDDNVRDSSAEEEDSDESDEEGRHFYQRSRVGFGRPPLRASVNSDVPYSTHTKMYKGHCNTRTVKDVNYYGLDDEYVVSGSDDGHFFIWDRKTCRIVNILEGDGEVVNVVQGHPYEPMIACSGIDSTVKIFGPGGKSRERNRAAKGVDIANPGGSVHSSLRFGGRPRRATAADDSDQDEDEAGNRQNVDAYDTEDESTTRNGLSSRQAIQRHYEITSQNDAERQRGMDDTFVTESMLARFAAALQRGELQGIAGQGFGGGGGTIVIDQDNCSVM